MRTKERLRNFKLLLAALVILVGASAFAGVQEANAAKLCAMKIMSGASKGHLSKNAARARAWVNWQGKMRNEYGRRFPIARASVVNGYPKLYKNKRRWTAEIKARGCYTASVGCVVITGQRSTCECETDIRKAAAQGCKIYAGN